MPFGGSIPHQFGRRLSIPARPAAVPTAIMTTSNLLFACAELHAISSIRREGLRGGTALFSDLEEARRRCTESILVVDAYDRCDPTDGGAVARSGAIENLEPYAEPVPVTAAGGFVLRESDGDFELLLIFRRGVWDLPKGKLDSGETVEECAIREVCEEVGIENVAITRPLGTTIHGYRHNGVYAVKTTHWFAMRTDEESFTPQRKEKIEKVEWVSLPQARERLGFETLRRHLDAVEDVLRASAANG